MARDKALHELQGTALSTLCKQQSTKDKYNTDKKVRYRRQTALQCGQTLAKIGLQA